MLHLTRRALCLRPYAAAIVYFALLVCALLSAAGTAVWYYEPIGLPLAKTMAGGVIENKH